MGHCRRRFNGSDRRDRRGVCANATRGSTWFSRPPRAESEFCRQSPRRQRRRWSAFDATGLQFDVVGNLDADVSFEPDYMEFLLAEVRGRTQRLGVAGTPFTQEGGYDSTRDSFEGENYVAGPCQLFRVRMLPRHRRLRRQSAGGVDWIAVMTARMKGWTVTAFPEKRFHHHRLHGNRRTRQGCGDVLVRRRRTTTWAGRRCGRCFERSIKRPSGRSSSGGLALLLGYTWAAVTRVPRAVSPELMRFHRAEQMRKLRAVFRSLSRFERVNAFKLERRARTSSVASVSEMHARAAAAPEDLGRRRACFKSCEVRRLARTVRRDLLGPSELLRRPDRQARQSLSTTVTSCWERRPSPR